ncbi:MAG TPA: DUF5345 family protein [Capillibacterium sp.]
MKKEIDFEEAVIPIKPALDAFNREIENLVTATPVPPLSSFQALVKQARRTARRRLILETILFPAVALLYLTGMGFLLRHGYTVPLIIFYLGVSFFLPFVILFAQPEAQRRLEQS